MRKYWFPVLCFVLVLPLLCAGCSPSSKSSAVSVTCDEFSTQKDIVKDLNCCSRLHVQRDTLFKWYYRVPVG